eukprot:scaffold718_cov342-Pavlova_lutheri.AAC.26
MKRPPPSSGPPRRRSILAHAGRERKTRTGSGHGKRSRLLRHQSIGIAARDPNQHGSRRIEELLLPRARPQVLRALPHLLALQGQTHLIHPPKRQPDRNETRNPAIQSIDAPVEKRQVHPGPVPDARTNRPHAPARKGYHLPRGPAGRSPTWGCTSRAGFAPSRWQTCCFGF